ncbi:MAG: DNA recombination protein RmuC [Sulfurimonas sp.]|nr:DNA recombination protein RmuC [Sulfurimonas sp.]
MIEKISIELLLLGVLLVLFSFLSLYLYNKINQLMKKNSELLNLKDIELATYKEKVISLSSSLEKIETLETKLIIAKEESSRYKTSLEEQKKAMQEKLELLQNSEEKLKIEFKNLASEIFENNSKSFNEKSQKNMEHVLKPMNQQLESFKRQVEDIHSKETEARGELKAELKQLKELNQKLSSEAHNLTTALKNDNKKQGNWGEMVLEKVLESSGLREGHEFQREVSLKDDENRTFRPDVIVNLPDNRHIIIDAKTSLNAYSSYMVQEDEELKKIDLKNHIKSMKEHIKGLANKEYEELQGINSLDFIFMFVPIESALLLALENDVNLYDEAFKQKIILVSPTTLLVALRAVENTWRYERQAQSIADVYKRAEELYKKFVGFVEDLKKVDKGLESAKTSYDEAFKKLSQGRGNLVSQATMLKQVSSIKPKKELESALVDGAMMEGIELK